MKTGDHGCDPRARCNRVVNANAPKAPWYVRQNSSRQQLGRAYPAAMISSSVPATLDHHSTALFRSTRTSTGSHPGRNNLESKAGVCHYSPSVAREPHILLERKRRWAPAMGPFQHERAAKLQKIRPPPRAQEIPPCLSTQLELDLQPALLADALLNSLHRFFTRTEFTCRIESLDQEITI
jgi:hypothetical protein